MLEKVTRSEVFIYRNGQTQDGGQMVTSLDSFTSRFLLIDKGGKSPNSDGEQEKKIEIDYLSTNYGNLVTARYSIQIRSNWMNNIFFTPFFDDWLSDLVWLDYVLLIFYFTLAVLCAVFALIRWFSSQLMHLFQFVHTITSMGKANKQAERIENSWR